MIEILDWKGGEAINDLQKTLQVFSSTLIRWKEDLRFCVTDLSAHG